MDNQIEYNLAVVRVCNEIENLILDFRTRFKGKVENAEYSLGNIYSKVNAERRDAAEVLGLLISRTGYPEE